MTQDTLHANGKFVLLENLSSDREIITELDQSMAASKDAIVCDDNHVVLGSPRFIPSIVSGIVRATQVYR